MTTIELDTTTGHATGCRCVGCVHVRAAALGITFPCTNDEYRQLVPDISPPPEPAAVIRACASWDRAIADQEQRVDLALAAWTHARRELHAAQRAYERAADASPRFARARQLFEQGRLSIDEWTSLVADSNARRAREQAAIRRTERRVEDAELKLRDARVELTRLQLWRQEIKQRALAS